MNKRSVISPTTTDATQPLKRAGVKPDIRIEARSQYSICSFVEAGAGVALIDPAVKQNMIGSNITIVPCEPDEFTQPRFHK